MSNSSSSGGIGFLGMLAIVFIVLKLTETIAWSWWWVLAPLWMPFALFILIVAVMAIGAVIITLWKD
jgi:hypothetical protein